MEQAGNVDNSASSNSHHNKKQNKTVFLFFKSVDLDFYNSFLLLS